jgi:orotate phosphoribosyltransferase-like protein
MTAAGLRKGDRAFELREQGVGRNEIAERLGVSVRSVDNMIRAAKQRRARATAEE